MATRPEPVPHKTAEAVVAPMFQREPLDFSLVLGGPIFQLLRKSHLSGDGLELLHRRIVFIVTIVWLPPLLLSIFAHAIDTQSKLSFLRDIEVQVRFLVALPVLVLAELIVHLRLRPVVRAFIDRKLVSSDYVSQFQLAVNSAVKLRNSIPLEIGLIVVAYSLGMWLWNVRVGIDTPTWYWFGGARWRLTPAGYYYVFVSIPIVQFILLRWYMRFFIWFRFLWQVSRLKLNLTAAHPDRCAGLAFLGKSAYAFSPILFAQGAMLAGLIARRVVYGHENLLSFKFEIVGFVVFFVFAILGPLLMFTPAMAQAKRKGLAEYGVIAQEYVVGFERKWIAGEESPSEELLGSGDIQSLADMGNSYSVLREMRPVPFGLDDISRLAAATAAPLLPLLLTIFSPDELFLRVMKIVL